MTSFSLLSTEYLLALKLKGWFDEGFYNEYDFICHELYDIKTLEESSAIQAEIFLSGESSF